MEIRKNHSYMYEMSLGDDVDGFEVEDIDKLAGLLSIANQHHSKDSVVRTPNA